MILEADKARAQKSVDQILEEEKRTGLLSLKTKIIAAMHIMAAGSNREKQIEHVQRALNFVSVATMFDTFNKLVNTPCPPPVAAALALRCLDEYEKVSKQIQLVTEVDAEK